MAMSDRAIKLEIHLNPFDDIDEEELDEWTRQLKNEINELDVESVETISQEKEVPEGAKAIDSATIGSLLVTLSSSGGLLTSLIGVIGSWLSFKASCKAKVVIDGDEFELSNISQDEKARLIELFINRHTST
jgi:hypothetical protein